MTTLEQWEEWWESSSHVCCYVTVLIVRGSTSKVQTRECLECGKTKRNLI